MLTAGAKNKYDSETQQVLSEPLQEPPSAVAAEPGSCFPAVSVQTAHLHGTEWPSLLQTHCFSLLAWLGDYCSVNGVLGAQTPCWPF